MPKVSARKKGVRKESEAIIIDEKKGLVFSDEESLYKHFASQIQKLEKYYFDSRSKDDISEDDHEKYEELLAHVLDDPDEIWEDTETVPNQIIHSFIGFYKYGNEQVYYVAICYNNSESSPSFVYLHFPSRDLQLVERFRRGKIVFDRVIKDVESGAIEGDALSEGDDLAVGLYKAMLKLRSKTDIPEEEFKTHAELRETTIEEPDEIWRNTDLSGNVLVSFIRDYSEENKGLFYIVITIEDTASSSHALLFSFPTRDRNLVDRYRHGENLQADEVVQEASH